MIQHLQNLTAQYENLFEKDNELKMMQQDIFNQRQEVQALLISKDELLEHITRERQLLLDDKLNARKIEMKIQQIQNQANMQQEDYRSAVAAQFEALQAKERQLQSDKQNWLVSIEGQKKAIEDEIQQKKE